MWSSVAVSGGSVRLPDWFVIHVLADLASRANVCASNTEGEGAIIIYTSRNPSNPKVYNIHNPIYIY